VINKTINSSTLANLNKQLIKDQSNKEWDDKIFSLKPIEELEFYNEINNLNPLEKISKLLQRKYEKLIPLDVDFRFKSLVKRVSRNRFFKLSAGQKQIVMLYRSFYSIDQLKPSLIFLDEPLNYLDYLNKVVIVKDIEKIVFDKHFSKQPSIIFIVSHSACFSFLHSKESDLPNKRKVKLLVIQQDHTLNEVKELQVRKGILPCEN
jgi:ABC-type lipoprotein export system ATPase subunit